MRKIIIALILVISDYRLTYYKWAIQKILPIKKDIATIRNIKLLLRFFANLGFILYKEFQFSLTKFAKITYPSILTNSKIGNRSETNFFNEYYLKI